MQSEILLESIVLQCHSLGRKGKFQLLEGQGLFGRGDFGYAIRPGHCSHELLQLGWRHFAVFVGRTDIVTSICRIRTLISNDMNYNYIMVFAQFERHFRSHLRANGLGDRPRDVAQGCVADWLADNDSVILHAEIDCALAMLVQHGNQRNHGFLHFASRFLEFQGFRFVFRQHIGQKDGVSGA